MFSEDLPHRSEFRNDSVEVLSHQLQADFLATFGLPFNLELGLGLPMTLYQVGGESNTMPTMDLSSRALGDLRLYPRWSVLSPEGGFGLAIVALTTLPTGERENLQGNASITVEPRLIAELRPYEGTRLAAHAGYKVPRAQSFHNIEVGNELSFGLAMEHVLVPERWALMAEFFGKVAADQSIATTRENSPMEALLGMRYMLNEEQALTGSLGPGLGAGYGAPMWRAHLGYAISR